MDEMDHIDKLELELELSVSSARIVAFGSWAEGRWWRFVPALPSLSHPIAVH